MSDLLSVLHCLAENQSPTTSSCCTEFAPAADEMAEPDSIHCGGCHHQFKLSEIEGFIRHKKDGCGHSASIGHFEQSIGRIAGGDIIFTHNYI